MMQSFDRRACSGPLVFALVAILGLSCSKHGGDPFDKETIERDLEKRTVRDLYDAVDKMTFVPPANGRLTEEQIVSFVRYRALVDRIREVAGRRFDDQIDHAGAANDRFSRGTWAASAIGSARAIGTAELRSAINLGLNPLEQQWVTQEIARCQILIQAEDRLDTAVAQRKKDLDDEIDFGLIPRRTQHYDAAVERRKTWRKEQGDAALANIILVRGHAADLRESMRSP